MTDINWVILTDAEQGQLVNLWMLAAEKKGQIISDPQSLKILCHLTNEPNISKFIELGFIDKPESTDDHRYTTGVPPTTDGIPEVALDKRRVEEIREEDIKNIGHPRSNDPFASEGQKKAFTGLRRFHEFWDVWPRKVKKKESARVWKSNHLDKYADKIIAAVPRYLEDLKKQKRSNGFDQAVAHPPTWLRGERWNDDTLVEAEPEIDHDEQRLNTFLKDPIGSNGSLKMAKQCAWELNRQCEETVMRIVGHKLDETLSDWNEETKQWIS